jgi:hypothetical protein
MILYGEIRYFAGRWGRNGAPQAKWRFGDDDAIGVGGGRGEAKNSGQT